MYKLQNNISLNTQALKQVLIYLTMFVHKHIKFMIFENNFASIISSSGIAQWFEKKKERKNGQFLSSALKSYLDDCHEVFFCVKIKLQL